MVTYSTRFTYKDEYDITSSNQRGERYKRSGCKFVRVCKISCEISETEAIRKLVILSSQLGAPLHYDFGARPQVAWLEVCAAESI